MPHYPKTKRRKRRVVDQEKTNKKMPSSSRSSSSLPLTTILILLTFLSFTAFGYPHHKGEPCSDDFAQLAEKMNLTHCKKLRTLGAEFGWDYDNTTNTNTNNTNTTTKGNTTRIEILFRAKLSTPTGWVAWGVNPGKTPQMVGTKAIIAIRHDDGQLRPDTYDVTKETRLGCRLHPSPDIGIQVLNMKAWSYDRPRFSIFISATLILPSKDYDITRLNHVWQVGNAADGDQPLQHRTALQNMDSTEAIDLTTPTGSSTIQSRSLLRSVHGVLNIIGWGTLLPIGVIIARYFRVYPFQWDPTWFYLHVGFQLSGFLIGTVGWAIGLSLGNSSKYYILHTHRTFGIVIFTFSTVQMLAFRLKPKPTDDYRKYWNMYHHFLGYGLLTVIVINIFTGISILQGGHGWKWTYVGILCLLGAITLALEITTWVRFLINRSGDPIKIGIKKENNPIHPANPQNKGDATPT